MRRRITRPVVPVPSGIGGLAGIWAAPPPEEKDMAIIGFGARIGIMISPKPPMELSYLDKAEFPTPYARIPVPDSGTLSKFRMSVPVNTTDAAVPVSVLVNGSSVGTITVPVGFTGDLYYPTFSASVLGGHKVSFIVDASGASGGTEIQLSGSVRYDPA